MLDRISIIKEKYKDQSDYQCDLCDQPNYPMLTWACTHDDNYIRTIVCISCMTKINISIPETLIETFHKLEKKYLKLKREMEKKDI